MKLLLSKYWFIGCAVLLLLSFGHVKAEADQKFKVLVVHAAEVEPYSTFMAGFNSALVEEKSPFLFQHIYLNNREKILDRFLKDPLYENIDLAIAVGTIALRALRDQKTLPADFPILFGAVSDPVGEKVIEDFNIPVSGRFTGVAFSIDIYDRLLEMKKLFPGVKKVGVIYSTMPQSLSFKRWLGDAAKKPEFADLEIIYRRVGTLNYKHGPEMMVHGTIDHLIEMKDQVDLFLSPNDQMGINPFFAKTVTQITKKPVFGLGKKDVMADMAAVASAYPNIYESGVLLAGYLKKYHQNRDLEPLLPLRPGYQLLVNEKTLAIFKKEGLASNEPVTHP